MNRHEETGPVLMDTHAWIWLLAGDNSLGRNAVNLILDASKKSALLLSSISLWEVAMLECKGRLVLSRDIHTWIKEALSVPGLAVVPITPEITVDCTRLPDGFHADPADRIIVATARHTGATLITKDAGILEYARRKHLKCVEA